MLKVFRRIRQGLIARNRVRNYMLYAIGEIILLVIGVFIALQINNYNEERKSANEGKKYIAEIYNDLSNDVILLNEIVERLREQYACSEDILRILDSPDHFIEDTVVFSHNWSVSSWPLVIDRIENTFYELETSGQSAIIRDDLLDNQLHQFYHKYDSRVSNFNEYPKWVRLEKRKLSYKSGTLDDYLFQKANKVETSNFINEVLNNELNYQLLLGIIKSCDYNIGFFEELSKEAKSIITYIEENYPEVIN